MRNKSRCLHFCSFTIIVSMFFIVSGCNLLDSEPYYFVPVASHQVTEAFGFSEAWMKENIFIRDDDFNPMMVVSQGKAAFLGGLDKDDNSSITVLEASDGGLRWQKNFGMPDAISATPSALYVGKGGGARVMGFEPGTGRLLWKTLFPGTRGLSYLTIIDNDVNVQASATHDRFFVLDVNTGEIVRQMEATGVFVSTPEVTFQHSLFTNELEAINTNTQDLLWSVKVDHEFFMMPVFTEQEILVRTDVGKVYCLERETGLVKWNTEGNIAISNLAVAYGLVYFLTRDGKLQSVDLQTGDMQHFVQFDTDRFVLPGEEHIGGYHVAYDPQTEMVFAGLGDSAQLFAFKTLEK